MSTIKIIVKIVDIKVGILLILSNPRNPVQTYSPFFVNSRSISSIIT